METQRHTKLGNPMRNYCHNYGAATVLRLEQLLPNADPQHASRRQLPDGTTIYLGIFTVLASGPDKPDPCDVDLGGMVPFTIWK